MKVEGSWHCKPWCTLHHKYPANEKKCSFDREHYSNYQKLKGLLSRLVKDGYGCQMNDSKLIVRRVIDRKVKTNKFRLDKDFYKLSAGEQIKKINKSLKTNT
jgi:hypothetical protein